MTAPVQTAGPVDPNAPGFAKFYAVLGALLSLGATAGAFGLITADQAAAIKDLGYQLGLTAGAAVSVVAAFRMRKQVRNGTFDAPPTPEPVDTKTVVAAGLKELVDNAASSVGVLNEVTQVAASVLPGLAPAVVDMATDAAAAVDKAITDFTGR